MINIMMCGNGKIAHAMLLEILSIVKYTKNEEINLYILTMDLSNKNPIYTCVTENQIKEIEKILQEKNKKSKVIKIDVTDKYKQYLDKSINKSTHYTPYSLIRILSDKIEELPEKILYLDCDIIAYGNIEEIFDLDIKDYEIAATRDAIAKNMINPNYINSGVVLMNLSNIRKNKCFEKSRELLKIRKMIMPDQTAINISCKHKLYMPDKYNEQKQRKEDTILRHFSMTIKYKPFIHLQNIKPWQIDKVHEILKINDFDDIYKKYKEIIERNEDF